MENFITCPNCGTENRVVKKVCHACFKPIGFYPNSPGKIERNAQIVEDVKNGKMTYKAIAIRNNISLERVRQIYFRELQKMSDNPVEFLSDMPTEKEITPELLAKIDKHIDRKIKDALDKYSL